MALEAKSAHVGEVALAAAFGNGDDVVGIPQSFAAAEIPGGEGTGASGTAEAFDVMKLGGAIETADGAEAAIALEDAFAQVAGVGAELPFLDAPLGAEGEAAGRDFELAPAAETAAVGTFGERGAIGTSAGLGAVCAH